MSPENRIRWPSGFLYIGVSISIVLSAPLFYSLNEKKSALHGESYIKKELGTKIITTILILE